MAQSVHRRHAILTMVGGAFWGVALALDDVAPDLVGVAVVLPVLLGFGVLEIYDRYDAHYGSIGRAGVALTGLGLAFLLVAILLYAVLPRGLLLIILVAVPGLTGGIVLAMGSGFLAIALRRLRLISLPTALLVGLGVPLTPLIGALLAMLVRSDTILQSVEGAGVLPGLSGLPYGVGWLLIGHRLLQTADDDQQDTAETRTSPVALSPQIATTAVVGGAFLVISSGRFLPLGPLSGTPWVNQSLLLDLGHLFVGAIGLGIAASRRSRRARVFNQAVGILSLLVVVLTLLTLFYGVSWLRWLFVQRPNLNMLDVMLYLPAGVMLTAVGFGLDPRPKRHQKESHD